MSRYATVDKLKEAAPQLRISANSRPTEDEVQEILDEVEADLDIQLANLGYTTPITGPLSLRILRHMVVQETISRTIISQAAGVRNPDDLGAKRAHEQYQSRLDALINPDNPFALPDADSENIQTKLDISSGFEGISDPDNFPSARITRTKVF